MKMRSLMTLILSMVVMNTYAMLPVVDVGSIAQTAQAVMQLKDQIEVLRREYQQLQDTHNVLTGNRGMGSLFNNPEYTNAFPNDLHSVYSSSSSVSKNSELILHDEKMATQGMNTVETESYIHKREQQTAVDNKAMSEMAYKGMQSRLNNIELLMAEVNKTKDPKGIAELQARIASEQAIVQNEHTKLTIMQNLQRSEDKLIEQKKEEMGNKILDPNNNYIPNIND